MAFGFTSRIRVWNKSGIVTVETGGDVTSPPSAFIWSWPLLSRLLLVLLYAFTPNMIPLVAGAWIVYIIVVAV